MPFHGGGVIYAHDGWPPLKHDERRIIGQVGEGILSQEDMSYLGGPVGFNAFRRSLRSGGASAPAASPGGGDNRQVHFHIGDIHINPPQGMTAMEAEQMVRRQILPAIEKVMGNRGLNLIG